MEFTEYVDSELFILIPVLYAIGVAIKKSDINDKWIPLLLGFMGIVLTSIYKFSVYSPDSFNEGLKIAYGAFTQGILCAASSVYANNIIKQMKGKKDCDNDSESADEDNNTLR